MWRPGRPDPLDVRRMREHREKHDLRPLVIHDSYLINLAALDPVIRAKSIQAFRSELERAVALGAEYLVAHPGSYKGQSCEAGIYAVVEALKEAAHGLRGVTLLLENTAGGGCTIGARFEELAAIRRLASGALELPIGFCLDMCHCYASGYDVSTAKGLAETVRLASRILGLENVPVIHANDSKGGFNSHVDRHANIGQGNIGTEGFGRILNHPKLRAKAFILETPRDDEKADRRDVEALKNLCRKSRTTIR
jgi:deoxyribonuclease IV